MSIKSITVGELETNCYLVIDDIARKTFIVDPGAEPERILSEVKKSNLEIAGIINTHGHGDHIAGNSFIKSQSGNNPPIYIHAEDAPMLTSSKKNLSEGLYLKNIFSPAADVLIKDGDVIKLSEKIKLKVIHTPGHTRGSVCFLLGDEYVLSGDTLFCGDIGRCDLPGGNEAVLMNSLKKLRILPESTAVLPGHGPASTIADELKYNQYLKNC